MAIVQLPAAEKENHLTIWNSCPVHDLDLDVVYVVHGVNFNTDLPGYVLDEDLYLAPDRKQNKILKGLT